MKQPATVTQRKGPAQEGGIRLKSCAWIMRSWISRLGLMLALAVSGSDSATPADSSGILQQFHQNTAKITTLFCRFTQERHLSLFKEPLKSEGFLCFQKPGKLRWEIRQPYQSILVSDGAHVAQFEWANERWQKLDIGLANAMLNVIAQISGILDGNFVQNKKDFAVSITNTPAGPVAVLSPQHEAMRKMMQAIEVHLSPALNSTRAVVLREKDGDFTEIQFADQKVELNFPARTFDLDQPADIAAVLQAARPSNASP